MFKKILISLNLLGNQLLGLRLENLVGDPTPYGAGHKYFNTTTGKTRTYDGAAWTEAGAGAGDMLAATYDPNNVGADVYSADNQVAGSVNTPFSLSEKSKLSGIAAGATVNDTDANLLARANHTGTQTVSTISDFTAEANALIDARTIGAPAAYDTFIKMAQELEDDDTATAALTALVATKTGKYAEDIGDGSSTAITVTHNLGSLDVIAQLRDAATNELVICDIQNSTTNASIFTFATAPASNEFRAVIVG